VDHEIAVEFLGEPAGGSRVVQASPGDTEVGGFAAPAVVDADMSVTDLVLPRLQCRGPQDAGSFRSGAGPGQLSGEFVVAVEDLAASEDHRSINSDGTVAISRTSPRVSNSNPSRVVSSRSNAAV